MQRTIPNLGRKTKTWPKKSHSEIETDIKRFMESGGQIEHIQGFSAQDVRPRASWSYGEGSRSGG